MAFQWHSTWAKRVDLSRKLDIPKGTNWNLEPKDTNRECQAIAWLAPAELVRSFGDLQASAVASNVPQPTWEFKPCFEAWRLFFRCLHIESTDQYRSILVNIGQYWSILVKCFTEIRYIQLLLHSPDLSSPLRKVLPDPHWISLGTSDVQHFVVPSQCRRAGIDFLAASWFSLVFHVQLWIKFTNATRFVTNEVPTTSRNIPQHTSNMCHPRSSSYIHQVPSPSHRGVHHIPKGLKGQQRPILEMKWAPQPFSDQNVTWMQKKKCTSLTQLLWTLWTLWTFQPLRIWICKMPWTNRRKSTEWLEQRVKRVACSAPVVTSSRATPQFRHSANLSWSHQGCAAAVASWGIHPRWTGTWGRVCTAVPMPADCSVPAEKKIWKNICQHLSTNQSVEETL